MSNQYAVIMAGGRGERFWPQSRLKRPKHLLPIVGDKAMLTQTVDRLTGLIPVENIFVITNREQMEAVMDVCPQLDKDKVIGEPVGRDTAAAVGLAKLIVKRCDPDAVFAMLPADHVIHDHKGFQGILSSAIQTAKDNDVLVTIGIKPTEAATGYGYIHKGGNFKEVEGNTVYEVQKFVEKPDLETANKYLESGEYFWNAGMFVWTVSSLETAFNKHAGSLNKAISGIEEELNKGNEFNSVLEKFYPDLEKISIDYAIMEKADNVVTLESRFDWDDVGEWPAIERHYDSDDHNNVSVGESVCSESENNIIVSRDGHVTALIGVNDLIVVNTGDATLICPKSRAQDIKSIVKTIEKNPDWKHLI